MSVCGGRAWETFNVGSNDAGAQFIRVSLVLEEFGRIGPHKEARDKKKHRIKLFPVNMEVQHSREKKPSDSELAPPEKRLLVFHSPAFLPCSDSNDAKNAYENGRKPTWQAQCVYGEPARQNQTSLNRVTHLQPLSFAHCLLCDATCRAKSGSFATM